MIRLFLFTLACAVMLALPSRGAEPMTPQEAFIRHFLRNYPKRMERALALLPVIDGYSALHAVNPVDVVVIIARESSFRPGTVNRGHGERGLMQVHGVCARGYDLSDPHQQIAAGVACLAKARDACNGSLHQTMSMYISGRCKPRTERTKNVVNRRIHIIQKWSK
jgi:hypothetical protein